MKKINNKNAINKLNIISRKLFKNSIVFVMLFVLLSNILFSNNISFAEDDDTRTITVTVKWDDLHSTSLRPSNITLHLLNTSTSDELLSESTDWNKNGSTWTYEFTVANNTNNYEVWEEAITNYSSTATSTNHMLVVNDSATITNKNKKTPITIRKVWENDTAANRPETITVHLGKTIATLITGAELNSKMKQLAGTSTGQNSTNNSITAIKRSETLNTSLVNTSNSNNLVSTSSSDANARPVYMWYENNTIFYYSEADNIYLNENSAYTFKFLRGLSDISGLADFNTSYVNDMQQMFYNCTSLKILDPIADWNVVNVENMQQMFRGHYSSGNYTSMHISSVEPLRNWDVSNVTDMSYMFEYDRSSDSFTSIEPLENWNVRCVKNFRRTFNQTYITDGYILAPWDIRSGTTFTMMIEHTPSNKDLHNLVPFLLRAGTWDDGSYSPNANTLQSQDPSHPYSTLDATELSTSDSGWRKNGNIWTYTFLVNNDGSKYTAWEDSVTNYTSSATSDSHVEVENNSATITNTNTQRFITITKEWDDSVNSTLRPDNITLHLIKNGVDIQSDNNNWTKNDNIWTYVFEVSDNDDYSIWEESIPHYTSNATQTSPILITNNSATITNSVITSDIILTKKVTGNLADVHKDFEFKITIYDDSDNEISEDILIERDGTDSQIENESTINLKHNEQVIIKNIITGYKYNIEETDTDYIEYYKIDKSDELDELQRVIISQTTGTVTGSQTLNENQTVTYINNKDSIPSTMVNTSIRPYVNIAFLSVLFIFVIWKKDFIIELLDDKIYTISFKIKE